MQRVVPLGNETHNHGKPHAMPTAQVARENKLRKKSAGGKMGWEHFPGLLNLVRSTRHYVVFGKFALQKFRRHLQTYQGVGSDLDFGTPPLGSRHSAKM